MPNREMSLPINIFLQVLIATTAVRSGKGYCPPQKQSDEPKFTKKPGSVDYVRYGHGIAVPCCAEGYTNISWYKLQNGIWKSFPPLGPTGDYNIPKLEERRQVLRFFDAKFTDGGSYRCNVTGKSEFIQHTTEVSVIACDQLARGPILTRPYPQNQTIYQYGGNITLHCSGYFGCADPGDVRLALWEVEGTTDLNITDTSPRYSEEIVTNPDGTMKQATLTITSVQEEDTKRTFLCVLATPQEKEGQTRMKVRIFKKDKPKMPWLKVGLIIGGCVLGVVIVISLVLCIRCLYGPQIRLYCSSRIPRLGPKIINNEEYNYNLFIYHADDDEVKAQNIKTYLMDKNYKVCIYADLQGNENILHEVFSKTAECALILFLYSDALRKDDLANFFLDSLITARKGKDILFLEVANYNPKEIMEWTRDAKDQHELQERNLVQRELGNGRNIEENENEESVDDNDGVDEVVNEDHNNKAVTEKKVAIGDDLKFWKVLPRIKVPADDKNNRKMENFWCSLQNKIPKFVEQKQQAEEIKRNKHRNSSSSRPLLESTRESETPRSPVGDTGELSPNTDNVFRFEESNEVEHNLPRGKQGNGIQTLVSSDHNAENAHTMVPPANRQTIQNENGIVRGENGRERENDFVYVADVHHKESSDFPRQVGNVVNPDDNQQNFQSNRRELGDEEVPEEETEIKSKEDIFTMSGEEPKIGSFDSESGYTGENRSGRGTTYPSSESGESSYHGVLSSQSSGFSEGSVSPPNCVENAYVRGQTNGKLHATYIPTNKQNSHLDRENTKLMAANGTESQNVVVKAQSNRNTSCGSPESGYNTSPSERTLSNGELLPRIKEAIERGADFAAEGI
ncbi:uncharacterized protein LOC123553728 isoform X2 [Mercenaria mercenaria]|uniref:uncharacterized protein LOC123553728 isoform X2 n=1 Tax=Mercenaria mercenaria TaxID=6596 RepID=UPI00234EE5E4|nr:uncharacterized protein LOC123553728 isoform X2 [Mercenaria mercenaria]XP_045199257.2 uncharacterized protein LOC123553728 isoform X2 [Mercenaria mercenaria]